MHAKTLLDITMSLLNKSCYNLNVNILPTPVRVSAQESVLVDTEIKTQFKSSKHFELKIYYCDDINCEQVEKLNTSCIHYKVYTFFFMRFVLTILYIKKSSQKSITLLKLRGREKGKLQIKNKIIIKRKKKREEN